MAFPHKNIRLCGTQYRGVRWYFVTLCCSRRRHAFADLELAFWMIGELRSQAVRQRFAVHAYCVMPDHLHALVVGLRESSDLLSFVRSFKLRTTLGFQKKFRSDLWQKKFYDHILRRDDQVASVAGYIWMNPVRKGFCVEPQEYPYSGSFVVDFEKRRERSGVWLPPWKRTAVATAKAKATAKAANSKAPAFPE
jgi:putative transposase